MSRSEAVLRRESEYHDQLYSGFAQSHFARPAVRAFRRHLARHILRSAALHRNSRVLSLGCGIGDTELLLAPHVREIVGIDISAQGIRQAEHDRARAGIANATFRTGLFRDLDDTFDGVIGIFFMHHLPGDELARLPANLARLLRPGGVFYGLDPSARRLSGAIGQLLFPQLMKKYQSADERELVPEDISTLFDNAGFTTELRMYDYTSTPLAGLFPAWNSGYRAARVLDEALVRTPLLSRFASNFELIARRPNTKAAPSARH